jgi:tetratricopeptide (TPR) repeat protein
MPDRRYGLDNGGVAFVVDDLGAWLVGLLADAGRRKLVAFVLGDEQVRALHQAARAALTATAAELRPGDAAAADEVAMVVGEVFTTPAPQPAGEHGTLLEDLRAGIAAQLAVLDDPDITTEPGWSSADALGVSAAQVAERLASRLVREITGRGARGGPLEPLASQLGHDRSFLLGLRLEGKIDHMDSLLAAMLAVLDEARPDPRGQEPAGAGPVVVGDVPQQPPGFVRRADLLAVLDAAGPGVSVVSAVTGMRGVGKTQLAAAYARAKLAEGWDLVAWVNAEDVAVLAGGLAAVAEAAGLAGQGGGDPGRAVRHWLEASGDRCLVVFDNAADADVLGPYLPVAGAARVLVTSNRQSLADLGTPVRVEVFTLAEAMAFLAGRTGLADPAGAGELAEELGYLPLALAQAAAVIRGQHLAYGTYLDRLRTLPVAEYLTRGLGQPYPHGVAEAVLLSLEAVRASDRAGACARVIEVLSVLAAAGVRRDLLHAAGQAGALAGGGDRLGAAVVDEALGRLAEGSLLAFSLDGQAVIAHRLVLRVVRDTMVQQGRLAAVCRAAASVLEARADALAGSPDRAAVRDVPEQVTALWQAAAGVAGASGELEAVLLRLRLWALYYLNELGDSAAQAIAVGAPLLQDAGRVLGPDHPDTLASRNNLAGAYRAAGRAAEAIPLHQQTLADRLRVLGLDHPDTLQSRNNLAAAYQDAGRAAEAIPLFEQTLAARERLLGPDHPSTLGSRNNLAAAYQDAGRAAEAIPLFEQTLAAFEQVLGPDHLRTLASRNNLAIAFQDAGRAAEAIPLHEQILADRERVLGPDHPDTLTSRNNLAAAYADAGRAAEAIPLLEQTLADRQRVLGPDHPGTLGSRNNLAVAYVAAGRAAEAIPLHQRTLADRERVLGPDHPDTLQSRNNLANAYKEADRAD